MEDLSSTPAGLEAKLESLARHIPGFSGYLDRERRRDADKLQREFMAKRLTELKSKLQNHQEEVLRNGNLGMQARFDQVANKMDRVIERLRHASYGYTGFFDAHEVNQEELDRIYDHDLSLVSELSVVDETLGAVGAAIGSGGDIGTPLGNLTQRVQGLDAKLDERERILKGVA